MKAKVSITLQILAIAIALIVPVAPVYSVESAHGASPENNYETNRVINYSITNPYENVDWAGFGQYKADLHVHSTNSDGAALTSDMVEDHYAKGYSILAMTDHNYFTQSWDQVSLGPVDPGRMGEIQSGAGRGGRGMIGLDNASEQSSTDHINTFFDSSNSPAGETMADVFAKAEASGGISHINHPGRYTGGSNGDDGSSIAAANDIVSIKKYQNLFTTYPSCAGMEIINKTDIDSKSDRVLWDNILKQTMPAGRPVWGFSNDDAHSTDMVGYSWNVMLMPELTQAAVRTAMTTGAFYAVSRVSRLDGINRYYPGGTEETGLGSPSTLYLLEQPTPGISDISVNGSVITITGVDCDSIEWIADGVVIYTGASLDLGSHSEMIGSYVRARLKSTTGIAFTQPFGVKEAPAANDAPPPDGGSNPLPQDEGSNPPPPDEQGPQPADPAGADNSRPLLASTVVVLIALIVAVIVLILLSRRLRSFK